MNKSDCDTNRGMQDFGTECVCVNAGYNVKDNKCECG